MGNIDIMRAVNLTSALPTSIEAWMSAAGHPHVARETLPVTPQSAEKAAALEVFCALALLAYTGGGPGLRSLLRARVIKYLQRFRCSAFKRNSSKSH